MRGHCSAASSSLSAARTKARPPSDARWSCLPNPCVTAALLHNLQYADEADPAKLLAAHREFDAAHARRLLPASTSPLAPRTGDRPLRLGFVSADFRQHPTGFLVLPALEHLDKDRCWVACYAEQLHEDQYTARFRAVADAWHTTVDLAPDEIAAQIREDEIDVLVDLMGHTGKNQLLVFAHKPAPVQITWFGYVGTTGLAAMDYLLADRFHVRPGEEGNLRRARAPHAERLCLLSGPGRCAGSRAAACPDRRPRHVRLLQQPRQVFAAACSTPGPPFSARCRHRDCC